MTVTAIIQARMSSKRLPGKVLLDIHGKSVLQMVVERLRAAKTIDSLVVATSTDPSDDAIAEACHDLGVECFRGNLHDVLGRFAETARAHPAENYVRITADCPLLDPALVDQLVESFQREGVDYASNVVPGNRTFPIGLDAEVFSRELLFEADRMADKPYQREHVTPYMYDSSSSAKRYHLTSSLPSNGHLRWTLDTQEDLDFIQELVRLTGHRTYLWTNLLEMIQTNPHLLKINLSITQKSYLEFETS